MALRAGAEAGLLPREDELAVAVVLLRRLVLVGRNELQLSVLESLS